MSAHCHDGTLGVLVDVANEVDCDIYVVVSSVGVAKTHTEEDVDVTSALDDFADFENLVFWNTSNDFRNLVFVSVHYHTECIEEFVVVSLLNLKEVVCTACSIGVSRVNNDDLSSLVSLTGEVSAWENTVTGEVSRVCVLRVGTPVDDDICTVLDFS